MKRNKLINKVHKKKIDKCCYFCGCDDYDLLDVHRIKEGADGGEYSPFNTVTTCCGCHRKIHAGRIQTFRKYYSSSGNWILHYIDEDGKEQFK